MNTIKKRLQEDNRIREVSELKDNKHLGFPEQEVCFYKSQRDIQNLNIRKAIDVSEREVTLVYSWFTNGHYRFHAQIGLKEEYRIRWDHHSVNKHPHLDCYHVHEFGVPNGKRAPQSPIGKNLRARHVAKSVIKRLFEELKW